MPARMLLSQVNTGMTSFGGLTDECYVSGTNSLKTLEKLLHNSRQENIH
jgi:hypothetical protein